MNARDPRGKTGSAIVTVTITRVASDRPPYFTMGTYTTTINSYQAVGSPVLPTTAIDPDSPNSPVSQSAKILCVSMCV